MGERLLDTQKVGSSILLPPTSEIKPSGDRVKRPEGFLVPGTHFCVQQELLDSPYVFSLLQKPGGKSMPEGMEIHVFPKVSIAAGMV